jgi:predicted transposase YbfD/YdcC
VAKAQGADVLVQVKANQPELLAACESLAKQGNPVEMAIDVDKGHGRIEERTTQVFNVVKDWLPPQWETLIAAIVCVHRKTTLRAKNGGQQMREETAWYICTASLPAVEFARAIRGHWGIEAHHHVRDVTFREDACRIRANPTIIARLRTMALNVLRHNRVQHISETIFRNAVSFEHLMALKGL